MSLYDELTDYDLYSQYLHWYVELSSSIDRPIALPTKLSEELEEGIN